MSEDTLPGAEIDERHDSVRSEISREMVRLYKEIFGRGPTKARTEFSDSGDILICTLENSLTRAEQRMMKIGEEQRVRDTRTAFQHATDDEFCGSVERILKRRVRAFVSGMDTEKDLAAEVFYLEPRSAIDV